MFLLLTKAAVARWSRAREETYNSGLPYLTRGIWRPKGEPGGQPVPLRSRPATPSVRFPTPIKYLFLPRPPHLSFPRSQVRDCITRRYFHPSSSRRRDFYRPERPAKKAARCSCRKVSSHDRRRRRRAVVPLQVHNWRFFGADIGSEGGREREGGAHTTSLPGKVNFSPPSSAPWEPRSETVCTGFLLEIFISLLRRREAGDVMFLVIGRVDDDFPCPFLPCSSCLLRLPRRSSLGSQWPHPKCRRACALAARMFPISPFLMPKLGTIKESLGRAHIVGSPEPHVCRRY